MRQRLSFQRSGVAICLCLAVGCVSSPSAYKEQTSQALRSAPTAQELETPIRASGLEAMPPVANGHADTLADAAVAESRPVPSMRALQPRSPIVEEAAVVNTAELHGYAFPGVEDVKAPKVRNLDEQPASPALAAQIEEQAGRIASLEAALAKLQQVDATPSPVAEDQLAAVYAELEALRQSRQSDPVNVDAYAGRLQSIEEKVAALESNATAVSPGPSEELEERLALVEQRLSEQVDSATPDREVEAIRAELESLRGVVREPEAAVAPLEERLARLETAVGELEAGEPDAIIPPPTDYEARLGVLEQRLDHLETASPEEEGLQEIRQELDTLQSRVKETPGALGQLTERLARLEREMETLDARAPEVVVQTPPDLETRLAAIEQSLAESETSDAHNARYESLRQELEALKTARQQPSVAMDAVGERLDRLENALASLESAPPEVVVRPPDDYQARLAAIEADVAEIAEQRSAQRSPSPETRARLDALDRQLADVEATMPPTAIDGDVKDLEARLAALQAQYESLEQQVAQAATPAATPVPAPTLIPAVAAPPAQPEATADFDSYRIGAGDTLEFQSFNDNALSREVTVRFDGYISLPLIPEVKVAGLTRQDAESSVRQAYQQVFRDPQLALLVRAAGSKTFTVIGDIAVPGMYPYTQALTLIDAISIAGGLRQRSSSASGGGGFVGITGQLTKAHIIRRVNGERQVLTYDLRGMSSPGDHSAHAPVYYGDLIYVPEGVNLVYVLGESGNRVIELTEGMTLLQLLSLSGGFNASTARLGNVVLMRQTDAQQSTVLLLNLRRMLRTGEDFKLQPGDIVYIPQKRLVRIEEFVRRFTGSISPFLNLYTSAVDAYYALDLVDVVLDQGNINPGLQTLSNIEAFGTSTRNIIDLFGGTTP